MLFGFLWGILSCGLGGVNGEGRSRAGEGEGGSAASGVGVVEGLAEGFQLLEDLGIGVLLLGGFRHRNWEEERWRRVDRIIANLMMMMIRGKGLWCRVWMILRWGGCQRIVCGMYGG